METGKLVKHRPVALSHLLRGSSWSAMAQPPLSRASQGMTWILGISVESESCWIPLFYNAIQWWTEGAEELGLSIFPMKNGEPVGARSRVSQPHDRMGYITDISWFMGVSENGRHSKILRWKWWNMCFKYVADSIWISGKAAWKAPDFCSFTPNYWFNTRFCWCSTPNLSWVHRSLRVHQPFHPGSAMLSSHFQHVHNFPT